MQLFPRLAKRGSRLLLRKTQLVIVALLVPSFYYAYYYNVWEYAMATPFSYFTYPLEVDMEKVVDDVIHGVNPGVTPLNLLTHPFVLNPDRKCKTEEAEDENIYMVMIIKSRMENFDQRSMIRRTWGNEWQMASIKLKRVFLLGVNPEDKNLQRRIGIESSEHEDIVQQYFYDSYFNNTLKLMMGFQWATTYCRGAKFLAFLDDDYYVSAHNLVRLLQTVPETDMSNIILGYIWKNAMPFRIKNSKWYISLQEYPYRFWPPYPTAGSFFVPMETAQRLNIAMRYTKIIPFDDVYIGIVAWKLKVKLKCIKELYFYNYPYDKSKYKSVIASHGYLDTEVLYKIWQEQDHERRVVRRL